MTVHYFSRNVQPEAVLYDIIICFIYLSWQILKKKQEPVCWLKDETNQLWKYIMYLKVWITLKMFTLSSSSEMLWALFGFLPLPSFFKLSAFSHQNLPSGFKFVCTSKAISILLARKISIQTGFFFYPFQAFRFIIFSILFFTVRKNNLKYWFNYLGGISWISRWSLGKADFIHRLYTSRSALAFCFVFFGTCASTKSLISSSFNIFWFVLFTSRRQKSTSYFPYIMYNMKKIQTYRDVQYGKNAASSCTIRE